MKGGGRGGRWAAILEGCRSPAGGRGHHGLRSPPQLTSGYHSTGQCSSGHDDGDLVRMGTQHMETCTAGGDDAPPLGNNETAGYNA